MPDRFEEMMSLTTPNMLHALGGRTVSLDANQAGSAKNIQAIMKQETRRFVSTGSADTEHLAIEATLALNFDDGTAYTPKECGEEGNAGDKITDGAEVWYLMRVEDGRQGFGGMVDVLLQSKIYAGSQEG